MINFLSKLSEILLQEVLFIEKCLRYSMAFYMWNSLGCLHYNITKGKLKAVTELGLETL